MTTVLLLLALSAPAPQPKPLRTAPLPLGTWITGTWGRNTWEVRFDPDGGYNAIYNGNLWHGSYDWHPLTRELTIHEWCRQPGNGTRHRVTLDRDLRGYSERVAVDLSGKPGHGKGK